MLEVRSQISEQVLDVENMFTAICIKLVQTAGLYKPPTTSFPNAVNNTSDIHFLSTVYNRAASVFTQLIKRSTEMAVAILSPQSTDLITITK